MSIPKINISIYNQSSSFTTAYPNEITESFLYVQRVGITYCKPDYVIEGRKIESNLICFIFKGLGTLLYNKGKYELKKGNLFIIDCSLPHTYYPDSQNPMCLLYLHFNGPMAKEYTNLITNNSSSVFNASPITENTMKHIGNIYKHFKNSDKEDYLEMANAIHGLLIHLLQATYRCPSRRKIIPSEILSASKYILQNHTKKISVLQVAKQVSMSEYHFIREFKKYIGQSPYDYLLYCRLNHAKDLLMNTDMSILDISKILNFSSVSHFTSFFKSNEKCTPLQFRKKFTSIT